MPRNSETARPKEPKAVTVARAHAEALYRGDQEGMRRLLAKDVHYTVLTTFPDMPGMDNSGIENFMKDVMSGPPDAIVPGSAKILQSMGDDHRALMVWKFQTAMGPGPKIEMVAARHYLVNGRGLITHEQVILFPLGM